MKLTLVLNLSCNVKIAPVIKVFQLSYFCMNLQLSSAENVQIEELAASKGTEDSGEYDCLGFVQTRRNCYKPICGALSLRKF